ncbi:hypothetical protein TNCV_994651 [Trichonephila clavipes]|nr:hypothetical protein TNCV_994651 [Trichonephila clavipes]
MSGRFLKVTVGDELEYRNLSRWLEQSGVEFKKLHVEARPTCKGRDSSPLHRPLEKDASINAGLLKDLLVLIEDTPCIDKQVFCRAFKNSLPALRSASADVDKSYYIFEAYSWHNVKNTRYGISLRNLVSNLRGAKLVAPQTATHLQPRQRFGSIIDLAVFKHIPYNHSVRVLSDLSSDHYPVILEINLNTSLIKNPEQLSTNWSNFKFVLSQKPSPLLTSPAMKILS